MDSLKRRVPKKIKCLHRFFKENSVPISEFYKEVADCYGISFKEAREKIENSAKKNMSDYFKNVIDEYITWSDTGRGYDFWDEMDGRFRVFYLKYFSNECFY